MVDALGLMVVVERMGDLFAFWRGAMVGCRCREGLGYWENRGGFVNNVEKWREFGKNVVILA